MVLEFLGSGFMIDIVYVVLGKGTCARDFRLVNYEISRVVVGVEAVFDL